MSKSSNTENTAVLDDLSRNVGETLRLIRGRRSQRQFAEQASVSAQSINNYENRKIPESWRFLAYLHDFEGVDLNKVLTESGGAG